MQKTFILLALLAVYGACHSFSDNTKVLQLTVSDFSSTTGIGLGKLTKNTFGMFYAPWCGHCKKLIPTYEEFAAKATDINVVAVDCTQNKPICDQLDVKGYPTLIYFTTEGKQVKYQKARTLDALVNFASTDYKTETSATDITFTQPSATSQTVTAVASNIQSIIEDLQKKVGGPIPLAGGVFALVLLTLGAFSLLCKKKEEETRTPTPKKEGEPKKRD